jgi:hypothetical protein
MKINSTGTRIICRTLLLAAALLPATHVFPLDVRKPAVATVISPVDIRIPFDGSPSLFPAGDGQLAVMPVFAAEIVPVSATGPFAAERPLLSAPDDWLDTPYGGPETALKVPGGNGTVILLLLAAGYRAFIGVRLRRLLRVKN